MQRAPVAQGTAHITVCKHILIASDGSRLAAEAVSAGLGLARALNAKVTAVTAEEPFATLIVAEASSRPPMREFEHAAAESARRILADVSETARKHGLEAATVQVSASPADAILATARPGDAISS